MTRYLGFCMGTEYEYGSGEIDEILIIMFMMIDMFISLIVSVARVLVSVRHAVIGFQVCFCV